MRSNKSLKRERSDGILKESKSSDDLKRYQECAKKLDECSKNLLRLCQQTNQGLYDDDVERAANEILKKEEAEAKRIAEELRIQRGVLNNVAGSNRNLPEGSNSRNLSNKSLRANSRKDLVYSGASGQAAGFPEHSQRPGMGENSVLKCDVTMPCGPCSGGRGTEFTIHNCEPKLTSLGSMPSGEPRQLYYGPKPPNDPSATSVYGASYGPGSPYSMRYAPEGSTRSIRYGPCTDAETGQSYHGHSHSNQYQDNRHQGPNSSEQYFRPLAESTRLKRGYTQPAWEPHQATTDFCQPFQPGNPSTPSQNEAFMVRARSQTTQLMSDGKSPIHIVITTQSEESQTPQQHPPRQPMISDCDSNQPPKGVNDAETHSRPGDPYLSKEDASRFLQCVLNCWNQMNQKSEAPKETKADKGCSRLIEFCCNLSSKSDLKKRDRKKRDNPKSKKHNCESQCLVCTPVDCSEGNGHKKTEKRSREKRKDWQAECQRMFEGLQSYQKNKAKQQRETKSTGCDADPCYEVYRDIYAASDFCKDYDNNLQDPYAGWRQQGAAWNQPQGTEYPSSYQRPHWGSQQGDGGTWNNPQTLICTEVNLSASNSPISSQTNLKTSSSDMDTSVLLAIAKAAINLSMEHHKGEGVQKDRRRNPCDDRDEDESSFCDMLESIFGQ